MAEAGPSSATAPGMQQEANKQQDSEAISGHTAPTVDELALSGQTFNVPLQAQAKPPVRSSI